jgi:hypothetical protein
MKTVNIAVKRSVNLYNHANSLGFKTLLTVAIFAGSFVLFSSCAKKGSPVRAVKTQTESTTMNNVTSTQSAQAAGAQALSYTITSISIPQSDESSIKIDSEIKTPDGRYIPITTTHTANQDSVGVIDDREKNGNLIDIRARCVDNNNSYSLNCEKYLMLATIVKNGYAVHQLAVVSYSNDCKFNLENISPAVSGLRIYSSLDDLAQRNTAVPQNDCPME